VTFVVASPGPGGTSFQANIPSFLVLDGALSPFLGDLLGAAALVLLPALVAAFVLREDTAAVRAMICSCSGLGASHTRPFILSVLYFTKQDVMYPFRVTVAPCSRHPYSPFAWRTKSASLHAMYAELMFIIVCCDDSPLV
jgi:hypothetical protein